MSFCPHLFELVLYSLCPHPERSRSSKPIQKCSIIIDLSVLIFINNCACDDPAGMLMSPQLELISCKCCNGRLSISPWSSAWLSNIRSVAVHFVTGGQRRITLYMTPLFSSVLPLGFIKETASPAKSFIFLVKVYVHLLHYSWLAVRSFHLIRRAISSRQASQRVMDSKKFFS